MPLRVLAGGGCCSVVWSCLPRSLEVESLKALHLPASGGREQLPAGIKAGKVPEISEGITREIN